MARIESAFDLGVEMAEGGGGSRVPPRFLSQTDAVLPADDAAHGENAPEQFVEDSMHLTIVWLRSNRSHQVDVNVAVPRMTKAGDRNAVFLLQAGSQPKEIDDSTPWHGDVFVQFHQPCVSQGVAKAPANLPDLFTGRVTVRSDDPGGGRAKNFCRSGELAFDGGGLAVKFDDEH